MVCSEYRELLSAHLDGELQAEEAPRVESHLRACAACRHHREQLGRAVGMVRGLDRHAAPQVPLGALRSAAAAEARKVRAERWEHIRSLTLAPPQPSLRPIVFAAVVFVLALAVYNGMKQMGALEGPEAAAPGGEIAGGSATAPAPQDGERPEWLKREIARRILEAQEHGAEPGRASVNAPAPIAIAGALPRTEPDAPEGAAAAEMPGDGEMPAAAPGGRLASVTVPSEPAGADRADGDWLDTPPSGAAPGMPTARPGPGDRSGARQERPVQVTVLLPPPAAGPATAPVEPPPASDPPQAGRRAAPTPRPPAEAPVEEALEITHHTVATFGEGEEASTLVFRDAEMTGDADDRSDPVAAERARVDVASTPEVEPAEPDPRTGIVPPTPVDRPGPDLAGRLEEVQEWAVLAPLAARLVVSAEGEVLRAEILTHSGLQWLDEEVVESLLGWTFRPAERDGEPIPVSLEVVVDFELE